MNNAGCSVRRAQAGDWQDWAELRLELWPDSETELVDLLDLTESAGSTCLLVCAADGRVLGMAEASVRHEYVNGTDSSPVGFLEGWVVHASARGSGLGRLLIDAVAQWARDQGCTELASDSGLANVSAQAAHEACGFTETERVVYYHMPLQTIG